jgi:hypothetical protein
MLQTLQEAQPETLDLEQLSDDWFSLLLDYTTTEVRLKTLKPHGRWILTCASGSDQACQS